MTRSSSAFATTRTFVSPTIVDFGSIADHTFGHAGVFGLSAGVHCNSGRGNLSETETGSHQTNSNTLINPHQGGQGPGSSPTDDCDPGNSGAKNSGGD